MGSVQRDVRVYRERLAADDDVAAGHGNRRVHRAIADVQHVVELVGVGAQRHAEDGAGRRDQGRQGRARAQRHHLQAVARPRVRRQRHRDGAVRGVGWLRHHDGHDVRVALQRVIAAAGGQRDRCAPGRGVQRGRAGGLTTFVLVPALT
ncbi:hypothetical protein G6F59_017285 [Rhizopus arrhizus]|nr:hypothetical protein G6F59_017285 [Rhizopus arrhizus]